MLSIASLVTLLTSCDDDIKPSPIPSFSSPHLVMRYIDPTVIEGDLSDIWKWYNKGGNYQESPKDLTLNITIKGNERSDFEALSEYYGDNGYTKTRNKPEWHYSAIATPGAAITVTCNQDYNSNYPAGTPLNDLVQFVGANAYYAIQNGYDKSKYPESLVLPEEYYSVKKPVNDLTMQDLTLLLPDLFYLTLTELPDKAGDYTFTINFKFEDGKELSCTVDFSYKGN